MNCKKCGGELLFYIHSTKMKVYELDEDGNLLKNPIRDEYDGRVIEEYVQCEECERIYAYDPYSKVGEELCDYPCNL